MTPIKPTVFGNTSLGADPVANTQRNQVPRLAKLQPNSNRSDNLFNSLLPTDASARHE